MPFFNTFFSKPTLCEWLYRMFMPGDIVDRFNALLFKHYMYKDLPANGRQFCETYNAEIQRLVPKHRLLVMNVKEGWEPLCDFLGHGLPEYSFPRKNDTATFQQNGVKMGKILNQIVAVNAAMTVGAFTAIVMATHLAWPSLDNLMHRRA